ncbi:uncharacterized protein LOC122065030 [Macadamia integrifolia]|uniref:uncharacterized protein LOC122065030 n=1 Tax=Macadamia integrifolia TaxID=60698 RepID=UPI001C4EBF93|nr:uncharacterized protein LOC122065030 [Macadamia integrifolia]
MSDSLHISPSPVWRTIKSRSAHGSFSSKNTLCDNSGLPVLEPNNRDKLACNLSQRSLTQSIGNEISVRVGASESVPGPSNTNFKNRKQQPFHSSFLSEPANLLSMESRNLDGKCEDPMVKSVANFSESAKIANSEIPYENKSVPVIHGSDGDSSRMHIFCLEHAVEVEKQIDVIGGVHMLLLLHPGEFGYG